MVELELEIAKASDLFKFTFYTSLTAPYLVLVEFVITEKGKT